jgi:hypothetical protein
MTCVVQVAKFAPQIVVAEIRRIDATLMVCHESGLSRVVLTHVRLCPRTTPRTVIRVEFEGR